MANTYTQLFVHIIFTVRNRAGLISGQHREELEKYISGIVVNLECSLIAMYCNPDHIHILIGYEPNRSIADIVRDIKSNSSRFINEKKWIIGKFNWQDGYGAFSCSKSQLDSISKYIFNQPLHHGRKTFKEEYLEILNKYGVLYDEKYLFN